MDIHNCCRNGNLDQLRVLIARGANISVCDSNQKDNNGWTPLHFASYNGHLEIVRELVKHHVITLT